MFASKKGLLFVLLVLLVTAVACQAAPADTSNEVPADSSEETSADLPEVTFVGTEYAYEGPESIDGGWTQVTFDNQGEMPHDLLLMRLDDGKTVDDVMAMLAEESAAPPDWINMVGGTSAGPGESRSFVSNLDAGSYVMISFGASEDGPPDAAQGMVGNLTVTEAEGTVDESLLPEATGTISLVDYQFVIDGLKSGEQTVRISNDGTELHEAIAIKLNEGATLEDVMAFMEAEGSGAAPEGEPPMDGQPMPLVFLSPGNVTYATLDLEPGNYVLLCFIPSAKNDNTPHMMLGMMTEVTIE